MKFIIVRTSIFDSETVHKNNFSNNSVTKYTNLTAKFGKERRFNFIKWDKFSITLLELSTTKMYLSKNVHYLNSVLPFFLAFNASTEHMKRCQKSLNGPNSRIFFKFWSQILEVLVNFELSFFFLSRFFQSNFCSEVNRRRVVGWVKNGSILCPSSKLDRTRLMTIFEFTNVILR